MSSREGQAMKSLEVALDHALARLNHLRGKTDLPLQVSTRSGLQMMS